MEQFCDFFIHRIKVSVKLFVDFDWLYNHKVLIEISQSLFWVQIGAMNELLAEYM